MDAMAVNLEALDSLVLDFAISETLIEHPNSPSSSPSSSSSSSSSYHSRLLIRQIRRLLESGDVDSAFDLLRIHTPSILDNRRLLFRLQKQKFIELLRRGTVEDRDAAIDFSRTALVPCALDAYPEAYEEFKHVLLALIYDKDDHDSPVANEWSERRRSEIAGLMSSILRAHLHAHDPVLSMSLRYLISIHKEFCFRQGVSSPISDLTERLLLKEKDPPATPEESLYEAPPFYEVDVQALAHAVELTRQGAVDSLRFAKGDLFQAFQNELCRKRLNLPIVDELVREYCVYRGIVDRGSRLQALSRDLKVDQLEPCSSRNYPLDIYCADSKHSDGESSISNTPMDCSEISTDMIYPQDNDVEMRFPSETTSNLEDCSTSGTQLSQSLKACQRNSSRVSGEKKRRRQWRGRTDSLGNLVDLMADRGTRQELDNVTLGEDSEKSRSSSFMCKDDKFEIVLGIKELATRGMAAEVVEEVNALDPDFFSQNPMLLFQLKQVEFLKLVESGDYSGALKVACSYLGPLAANDPALLKPLKETLLALLSPNEDAFGKDLHLHTLASSLQVALGRRLGVEEPQLMKIMRATLHTHQEWFKLQMWKDRFESLLKIDALKEVNTNLLADAAFKSNIETLLPGSYQATVSSSSRMAEDGNSPTQVSSRDLCEESAILKVMEFLALPRADAIHLLAQYNGNAETVIQQILA